MKRLLPALLLALPLLMAADKGPTKPASGTVFSFEPNSFKFINCDAEFRDPSDKRWPNFFYGRPAPGGTFTYSTTAPKASFGAVYDKMTQPNGDQSRKVLGELCKPGEFPTVTFTVNAVRAIKPAEGDGKGRARNADNAELDATLQVGTRKVSLKPTATLEYHTDKAGKIIRITCNAHVTMKPADLGLKTFGPKDEIKARFTINGVPKK